jgi:hypothetical protein
VENRERMLTSLFAVLPLPLSIDTEEDAKKAIDAMAAIQRLLALHIFVYDTLYGRGNAMVTVIQGLIQDYREAQEADADIMDARGDHKAGV